MGGWVDASGKVSAEAIKADLVGLDDDLKDSFDASIDECAAWSGNFGARMKREAAGKDEKKPGKKGGKDKKKAGKRKAGKRKAGKSKSGNKKAGKRQLWTKMSKNSFLKGVYNINGIC